MALPSKLGPNGSDIGGLVGSITSYGVNADAVVQEGFFGAAPASSVSMALSAIEGADLCSAAMDLVAVPVNMSLSATEGADTASATMSLAISMGIAATEGAGLASGSVALVQSMALSATEGADLASGSVALVQSMSLAAVEGADLCAASMDVEAAASVDMALDATEGADTCSALMDVDSGITDNQVFRIYNLRKKKRKPRVELVLDMDLTTIEVAAGPVRPPVSVPEKALPPTYRVTALDLAMVRPMEIKVRPKPVFRAPIQTLVVMTAEDERKKKSNRALRLLLLAS